MVSIESGTTLEHCGKDQFPSLTRTEYLNQFSCLGYMHRRDLGGDESTGKVIHGKAVVQIDGKNGFCTNTDCRFFKKAANAVKES